MIFLSIALMGCQPDADVPQKRPDQPSLHEDAVFRLEFEHATGSFSPGSGFVGRLPGEEGKPGEIIGLTAHHLFSPAGGLERELTAGEVPRFVLKILPTGLGGKKLAGVGGMRALPGSQVTQDRQDWRSDLAMFDVDASGPGSWQDRSLPLAQREAAAGDTVFVVVVPHRAGDPRYHKALVTLSTQTLLLFRFEGKEFDSRGTSGAPVVDVEGNVLAMNMAEGSDGMAIWGSGHPAPSMIRRLRGALSK